MQKYSSHISLESTILPFNWAIIVQTIKLMFPDSSIAKDFKCSCTKATAVLKVIARFVGKPFLQQLERLNTSASKLMRQLILLLHNKLLLCFDSSITPNDR